jgi:Bacterial capsule synthesis protein PGA_cap
LGAVLGFDSAVERRRKLGDSKQRLGASSSNEYSFGSMRFELGDRFGVRTTANKRDVEENLQQIKEAHRMSDWVVVSFHCHELGGENLLTAAQRSDIDELADFAVEFAHQCIDAGADVFVAHGPQEPFGVEIYQERPIFYSLGTTIFELETPQYLAEEAYARYGLGSDAGPADFADTRYQHDQAGHPADPNYWKQIAAKCEFKGKKLERVDLYPLDLGFGKPRWQRGRPLLADEKLGREIIDKVAGLSRRRGVEVKWVDGRGVIAMG